MEQSKIIDTLETYHNVAAVEHYALCGMRVMVREGSEHGEEVGFNVVAPQWLAWRVGV